MIDKRLTGGAPGTVTDLQTLNRYYEEFKERFPPKYFPMGLGYPEPEGYIKNFYNILETHVEPGINENIVYLVAAKNGQIISDPEISTCLIPKGAYIGRYRIDYTEDQYGRISNEHFVCDYWVKADEITLVEDRSGDDNSPLSFAWLTDDQIPKTLRDELNEKEFFRKWLI